MSHVHAFFMHTYHSSLILILMLFSTLLRLSLSLSLSLSRIVSQIVSGASSSSDSSPLHVRFCDNKARQDFSENFSRRGIHSKC